MRGGHARRGMALTQIRTRKNHDMGGRLRRGPLRNQTLAGRPASRITGTSNLFSRQRDMETMRMGGYVDSTIAGYEISGLLGSLCRPTGVCHPLSDGTSSPPTCPALRTQHEPRIVVGLRPEWVADWVHVSNRLPGSRQRLALSDGAIGGIVFHRGDRLFRPPPPSVGRRHPTRLSLASARIHPGADY
jgi:hypothetical protein